MKILIVPDYENKNVTHYINLDTIAGWTNEGSKTIIWSKTSDLYFETQLTPNEIEIQLKKLGIL